MMCQIVTVEGIKSSVEKRQHCIINVIYCLIYLEKVKIISLFMYSLDDCANKMLDVFKLFCFIILFCLALLTLLFISNLLNWGPCSQKRRD